MGWWDKLFGKGAGPSRPDPAGRLSIPLPEPDPDATVYGDQPLRKQWAEDVLRAEGVPINPHLPMIESEAQITLRTAAEVAGRLSALSVVAARASGLETDQARHFITERGLAQHLSPAERAFMADDAPSERNRIQFSWRYEAAWVLLWALQHVDGPLDRPNAPCDVDRLTGTVIHTEALDRPGLRRANDILNEADLIYRRHWAVRQAGLDGREPPADLHPGVVMERHHALNWLIGYADNADWDDVTTDT